MWKYFRPLCLVFLVLAFLSSARAQVVISEVLADNETGLRDEDREFSDWIELFNTSAATVNLQGWSLTDDPGNLVKWQFPATNVVANGYVVVFASGKNRVVPGKNLHTSFNLSSGGEFLALVKPDGRTIATQFAPEYPQQNPNVSYGFATGAFDQPARFFSPPTPGTANPAGASALSVRPVFSLAGGAYTNTVTVSLSSPETNAVIRYTINGTDPTATSTIYTGALSIANTQVIRAKAFTPGLVPSTTVTRTFTILSPELVNFSSNLPILVLTTFGLAPNETSPIAASATLIGTNSGRAVLKGMPEFEGRGTIKIRGSSSTQFPKKSFAFEIEDELLQDRKVSLLGLPKQSDWVLYAPYTDKTLMRDFLSYELCNDIGTYAPHCRFIEVYVDSSGGKLTQSDYVGVYVLIEKIKRDPHRVNIAELLPSQTTAPEVTGGYIFKKDRLDPGDVGFSTSHAGGFAWVEPKEQQVVAAQKTYFQNYVAQFESALYAANFTNKAYTNFYDVAAGIDHHWMVEATKNIDGFRLSTYAHKDRLGRVTMGPIWDYNLTLGNANYLDGWITNGWYAPNLGDGDYPWYRQLFLDPDFNQQYIDRWAEIRKGPFATETVLRRVDEITANLNEAAARNYVKWPILGVYVWPNPDGYQNRKTFQSEIDWMKAWITGRFGWIDSQFIKAPLLGQPGGSITQGMNLTITKFVNPVYYTMDGTDPRAPGGGISPKAKLYSAPFAINANARVVARSKSTAAWSAPVAATYVVSVPTIAITEIMYNPAAEVSKDYEFIELKNVGATTVDLNGFRFTAGIDFAFTNSLRLAPGKLIVLVKNMAAFTGRFDTVTNVVGQYSGALDNSGEHIALVGPMGETVMDFSYNNGWYPVSDGYGFSLVIRNEHAPFSTWDAKESWRASANLGGSPGQDDPAVTRPPVYINEILTHSGAGQDWIELFNPNAAAVEIGNWFLSDDPGAARKFKIPAGTILAAGGFKVFSESDFNTDPLATNRFALRSGGDEIFLFSADSAGNLTGFSDGFSFEAAALDVTFGRYVSSDGKVHYPAQKAATPSGVNVGPAIGPVVINEIRYAPGTNEAEFVELKNITGQTVNLFDSEHPTNAWRINGLDFSFPTNVSIPANGLIVVTQIDPARFRASNNVPTSVQLFGPYAGGLQDNGEMLELLRPDAPGTNSTLPMIVVDAVRYNDTAPWPTNAVGAGVSLERIYANQYGDDPANWRAAIGGASPGLDNNGNRPPVVQPGVDQAWQASRYPFEVSISATVLDDGQPADIGKVTVQWTQTSGPFNATFVNPNASATTVVIPAPGTYVFTLRASDGLLETTGSLAVDVRRPSASTDFIAFGSAWSYLDTGVDLGSAWIKDDFDASAWKPGNAQFGYGDGDETTVVSYGPDANNKFITTYFLKDFQVSDPASVSALTLRYVRDDGLVVYMNGAEIFRDANMPAGPITYTTPAVGAIGGADESAINETQLDPKILRTGSNRIGVEVHQANGTSSDISFDLQLNALTAANTAPLVDAGPDLQIGAGDWLTINGSFSDDALPDSPGVPTIAWVSETNPTAVTFSAPNSPRTSALFDAAGVYTLALSANDGALISIDRLTVTVTADDGWTAWRKQVFTVPEQADPNISSAGADPDRDGMSNRDEFVADTDPKNAGSVLRLDFSGGALQFQAKAGRAYILYYRAAFTADPWQQLTTYPSAAGDSVIQIADPQPGFYRLSVSN